MKTIAKRLIAAVAAMTMLIPSASVWAAKGETDVDIAAGKSAISACYGNGSYAGGTVSNVTSGSGIFISDGGWNTDNMEVITIDLGARYPINQIDVWNYYGYTAKGGDIGFYPEDVVFDFYVTNTKPANQKDKPADAVKLNVVGDSKFIDNPSGGFDSHFALDTVGDYRYVQLRLLKGTSQNTAFRIGQINVWTTAEAAANVPTVVSVGKPVYSQFRDGYNYNFIAFNDGKDDTSHWVYVSGSLSSEAGFYDHIIDLEAKYPIEKVVVNQDKGFEGSVDGVQVSNDPTFASSVTLTYDASNDEYYLAPAMAAKFGKDYKFVKVNLTPGARGSDWMVAIKEVSVYSTSQAAAAATAMADRVEIGKGKAFKSNEPGYGNGLDDYANDGDNTTAWFTFAGTPQITFDLGAAYPIENVRTYKGSFIYGGSRNYAIAKVEVSNDPSFNSDSVVTLTGSEYRIDNASHTYYTSYSQPVLPSELGNYRYVRVTGDQSLKGSGEGWQINEVEIYTSKEAAALENVSLDSTATFINGGGVAGGSLEALLDGNSSTHCYSYGGMAVIKLPYPMTIEQIEVDSRPGFDALTGNFTNPGGYNIWISHEALTGDAAASMPAGTVKVSSATRTDQTGERLYHAGATVVTEVEDETRYSYVTVQCPGNGEFFIYDVRILSNDTITGSNITNELTGEQANGEVLTLTTSWRCEVAPTETVNLYIARYDNGALTDVKKSADKTLSGQTGSESFEYTITEDVTAQTEFKGFVWEKDTLNPFA